MSKVGVIENLSLKTPGNSEMFEVLNSEDT
jgi:hypothetical protein